MIRRGNSVRKGWRKSMWGRFGQRRRSKRGPAVERATNALQIVWGRFGEGRTGRKERAYGSAVWLGAGGVLAMATQRYRRLFLCARFFLLRSAPIRFVGRWWLALRLGHAWIFFFVRIVPTCSFATPF